MEPCNGAELPDVEQEPCNVFAGNSGAGTGDSGAGDCDLRSMAFAVAVAFAMGAGPSQLSPLSTGGVVFTEQSASQEEGRSRRSSALFASPSSRATVCVSMVRVRAYSRNTWSHVINLVVTPLLLQSRKKGHAKKRGSAKSY